MRTLLISAVMTLVLAGCGQTIQARCSAAHPGDNGAYGLCVQHAEAPILTGPGSAFRKSQRGGPG